MRFDLDFILDIFGKSSLMAVSLYLMFLWALRQSRYYRLDSCPKCGGRLSRHKRKKRDRWTRRLSFGILPVKRYRCYRCYWEGQAFNINDARKLKGDGAKEHVNPTS